MTHTHTPPQIHTQRLGHCRIQKLVLSSGQSPKGTIYSQLLLAMFKVGQRNQHRLQKRRCQSPAAVAFSQFNLISRSWNSWPGNPKISPTCLNNYLFGKEKIRRLSLVGELVDQKKGAYLRFRRSCVVCLHFPKTGTVQRCCKLLLDSDLVTEQPTDSPGTSACFSHVGQTSCLNLDRMTSTIFQHHLLA